jgi:hypothetical protein
MNGTNTLINSEVTNINSLGFYVLIDNKEYFVPFREYPAFKNIPVSDIFEMILLSPEQLYWEKYDIDIELSALKAPHLFPLSYK